MSKLETAAAIATILQPFVWLYIIGLLVWAYREIKRQDKEL